MANNAWDRQIINVRERPLSSDINIAQAQIDRSIRDALLQVYLARASGTSDISGNVQSGFLGDAFKVRPNSPAGLSVTVSAGMGFQYLPGDVPTSIGGVSGLDDLSVYKPLPLLSQATISGITAGPAVGQDRYDIIEVRMNRVVGNPLSRDTLDVTTGAFVSGLLNKTLGYTLDGSVGVVTSPASSTAAISYKVGVAAAVGAAVEPSVTTGYVKIATIFSSNGNMTSSVTKANIIDQRVLLAPYGSIPLGLVATIPNGASSPPINVAFDGPAGVEAVVVKTAAPNQGNFSVFFLGGAVSGNASLHINGTVIPPSSATNRLYSLDTIAIAATTLTSANVTALANSSLSSPAASYPVGHPCLRADFVAIRQSGSTTDQTLPDPLVINLSGMMQRY